MKRLLFVALALTAMVCCWQSNAVAESPVTDGLMLHLEAGAITGLADGEAITAWPATVGNDPTIVGEDPNYVAPESPVWQFVNCPPPASARLR